MGKSFFRGIIPQFRLFLGVQVVEVAEELIKAMHGGQKLVLVPQVVLAELAGGVAQGFQQFGNGGILGPQAHVGSRHAHLAEAGAEDALAGDEGRAAGSAALLAVVVGEDHALVGDAVDVRGAVAHHALAVAAEVPHADVIAPEDENVGFLVCHTFLLVFIMMVVG